MKICSHCKQVKKLSDFFKNKRNKDGVHDSCKKCKSDSDKLYRKSHKLQLKKLGQDYYLKNKQHHKETSRVYYLKHKTHLNKLTKKYYREHKEEINKKNVQWTNNKRKANPIFKLSMNLRHRVYLALKNNFKSEQTFKLIGCSIEFLKKHLESKFTNGMTWDNYGKGGWVVDHIKPCISFDLSNPKEQLKCFNYSNLQPLWEIDNLIKKDKIL